MPTRRLTVSVPKPCHEDWNAMTSEFQGRFCQSCSKTVVDFTMMSDAEVVKWLTEQKGSTCGRFSKKQIGRELVAVSAARSWWRWKAAALGLSAWLSAKTAEAHAPNTFSASIRDIAPEEVYLKALSADSLVVFKGRVLDAADSTPIPGTTVQLKGTSMAAPTDANGYFSLNLPVGVQPKEQTVIFSFIGYVNQEQSLAELMKMAEITVLLNQDTSVLGETVIVGGYHINWFSPRNLYYKIKNLFR